MTQSLFILILLEKNTFLYKSYVLEGGGYEAVQGDDEALNGNGKAFNGNGKALKCVGEALKKTLFSQKKLIYLIAINMTFNHQHCNTRNAVKKPHQRYGLHLYLFVLV